MNRATLARRYGPLLAVAAVQLLIIAVVPSTAQRQSDDTVQTEDGRRGGTSDVDGDGIDDVTGEALSPDGTPSDGSVDGTAPGPGAGGSGGSGSGGGGAGGGGSGGAGSGGGGGGVAAGDTSHCKAGRQFDPAIYEWAPPCVPKFTGDNGGAPKGTRGVTKDTIKVVAVLGNYGAAVQKILESQGSPTFGQFSAFAESAEKFINANYELYGRKVDLVPYQFKATTGGEKAPNDAELRNEVRQIVQAHNPFAITWANSVSSGSYDEFSRLKVVNLGGYGFSDEFNLARRPYHWDVQMGGYQLAENVSAWYCNRMHGGGSAKATYAKSSSNFPLESRNRTLGIITTDDIENLKVVTRVKQLLKSKCGVEVNHEYKYAQDISTLPQQRQAAYEAMTKGATATTVMCFCDQVAPTFLYKTCSDNQYFPEHAIVATGVMDLDRAAQAYDHGAEYPQKPSQRTTTGDGLYEQFENAFGLAQFPKQVPFAQTSAVRAWKAAGNTTELYHSAEEELHYYAMLAGMMQMAGPKLTPANLEQGAARLGKLGSTTHQHSSQRSLGPGDYTWNDSMREVYWAPLTPSAFNNVKGSYTSLNGGRSFLDGNFPNGLLALPPKPRP